jgi:hypothetical protein
MNLLGGSVVVVYIIFYIGLIAFIISLLWRITVALEKMARHLLEIARDIKELSLRSPDEGK